MSKLLSFEKFLSEMDKTEEIEQEILDLGEPEDKTPEQTKEEAEEVQSFENLIMKRLIEELEELEDDEEDDEHEAEETSEEEAAEEEAEEVVKKVTEMLEDCYAAAKNEAKAWEEDAHDEHTIETYMTENAALVASLSATALKEMKDEYAIEAYEAALNSMVEAYTKKINEMKEANSSLGSEGDSESMED